ncbi:MAG TPA: triose-phosphate isomerase [Pusillimonas sp.]|uniref:triose-phosphate isomerase n=1 Tax=Pusillimonas sp. TaxID=3040095 RepID=UPI002CDFFA1E|nr:triose-phosphate isomerase [Pusillimonas sp.]HUH86889.1 triose-phosphate isomerase [Pusillimonas sp.]
MNTASFRKRLVMGNWKMHGGLEANAQLLTDLRAGAGILADYCTLAVCVPFPYLEQARLLLKESSISWGAQDISAHERGAYTGEVSAGMLREFACTWVLVGHSERRAMHGETDALVAAKAKAALAAGLTPVVCVGETLEQQEAGQTLEVIGRQLEPVLALGEQSVSKLVVAYEPVWAIGTGRTATPGQAQEVHAAIRAMLNTVGASAVRVLYGGSVKADNAASLFAMPDIDGALVGGASLVADEFLRIAAA